MKWVKEIGTSKGSYYKVYINEIEIKTIKITRIKRERNGFIYFFLFDSDGRVINEVYRYLNIEKKHESVNSKEPMLNALKLLYAFKEIVNKPLDKFDRMDIANLSNFILGIGIEKDKETINYIVDRGGNTHNMYLDSIRRFYKYLNIDCHPLFAKRIVNSVRGGYGILAHTKEIKVEKYNMNKSITKRSDIFVPKYISLKEYKNIIKYIERLNLCKTEYLRDRIIIDLMYITGMRIGEVLGLTYEDIKENINNPSYGMAYLRNRISDKSYQHAKTCMKVKDRSDYDTGRYKELDGGYQIVDIGPNLYHDILEYMDISRNIFSVSEQVMDNIANKATADSVEGRSDNQYIFLNKRGIPLALSGWNKFLKKVFVQVGINIDKMKKKNSLSHRFRHGYAMYLIDNEKRTIEYVQKKMRHRSIQSTMIYYNPREEDRLKNVESMEKKIREELHR